METSELIHATVATIADRIALAGPAGTTALTGSIVDQLYTIVAERLNRSPIGARFLRTLETQPADPATRRDVTQAVAAEAEADGLFADELRRLAGQLPFEAPGQAATGQTPPRQSAAGQIPPGHAAAGRNPPGQYGAQPWNPTLSTGGIAAIIAVAVVLLLISTTILIKVVMPPLGLTEAGRLDRVEGTWTGQDDSDVVVLTVHSGGLVSLSDEEWPCPGSMTSPGRSSYVLEFDCGFIRFSLSGELNLIGNRLTISSPGEPRTIVFSRD